VVDAFRVGQFSFQTGNDFVGLDRMDVDADNAVEIWNGISDSRDLALSTLWNIKSCLELNGSTRLHGTEASQVHLARIDGQVDDSEAVCNDFNLSNNISDNR